MTEVESPAKIGNDLTSEKLEESLSVLGHNSFGQLTYVKCVLDNCQLSSIDLLAKFSFLQRLSLNHNNLTSLKPLRGLSCLVYLSAHHNKLTSDAFADLQGCAFMLEHLDLSYNRLTSLAGLEGLPYLIDFSADYNRLEALRTSSFTTLRSLMRLSLKHNEISHVDPDAFTGAPYLRHLCLSMNRIPNAHFASCLILNLDTLLLDRNKVTTLGSDLSNCKSLITLDLYKNVIDALEEFDGLRSVRTLRHLNVAKNTCFDAFRDEETDGLGSAQQASPLSSPNADDVLDDDDDDKSRHNDDGDNDMLLSRSEIVIPDEVEPAEADRSISGRAAAYSTEQTRLNYQTLATPQTSASVGDMISAKGKLQLPWGTDRLLELEAVPKSRQIFLRLLFMFPQLSTLNDVKVQPDDVAKAMYFFEPHTDSLRL